MLDKKGFSLIELIICIALMGILSVSAFSLASHIKFANSSRCIKVLNQKLEIARMTTMSKAGEWSFFVYRKSDGIYCYLSSNGTLEESKGTKLAGSKIHLYYTKKGGSEEELEESIASVMHIKFSKNTGAFLDNGSSCIYEQIRVAAESSKGDVIELVEKTGKHILK